MLGFPDVLRNQRSEVLTNFKKLSENGPSGRRVPDVPERFSNNGDDRGISDFQPFSRTSLKWKSRGCPTKNCCANLTPLRFCRYFTDNDSGLVTSYIVQRNM